MRRSVAPPPGQDPLTQQQLAVDRLGPARLPSPYPQPDLFVDEDDAVLAHGDARDIAPYIAAWQHPPAFEPAGPRREIFFDPAQVRCAVVTCGGLCPGQNDVIRSLMLTLKFAYGVQRMLGFRYGYAGLSSDPPQPPMELTKESVSTIHEHGGTILASSRGAPDVAQMVDALEHHGVDVLFTIGGDGTLRGASAICAEVARRGLTLSVVGVPKTIDNDLQWVERSFGFATAVQEARRAIMGAHIEAQGAFNGVGLVKVMGRHSGFIAVSATLATSDVNFCLVPEVPLSLDGPRGLFAALEKRLQASRHAVVVVGEGTGQDLLRRPGAAARDASGNVKLNDIGTFLRDEIVAHFAQRNIPLSLKYIDPSYIVRSLPANAIDSALCLMLGQYAVHAAMAGRTNLLVGYWNQRFTHVPLPLATGTRKQLDPRGELWQAVLSATGQPAHWNESGASTTSAL